MKRHLCCLIMAATGLLAPVVAMAQTYPSKSIRMIFPFPPGGPSDIVGRVVSQKMSENMGQSVVSDNRPGAGGNLGTELLTKAPPDGYTLMLSSSSIAISPSLYKLNYDTVRDLTPIARLASIPNVMLVHPSLPVKSLKELIALARKNPGKLNYGSGGAGTTNHLASEMLKVLAKVDIVHVPYKGASVAAVALIGGEIDMVVVAVPSAASQIQSGKVRPIAVLSDKRVASLPDTPTAAESGWKDLQISIWFGLFGPAGMPRDLVTRLNMESTKSLSSPDMRERLIGAGIDQWPSSPEEFGAFLKMEIDRYAKVIRSAGIKAN